MNTFKRAPYWLSPSGNGDDYTQTYPSLEENITADICVVGGGITGVMITYALAQQGVKVVLMEKETLGSGATGRNTGFILSGTVEHYNRAVTFWGKDKAKRVWKYTQRNHEILKEIIKDEKIDCDYEQKGSLVLATTEQEGKEIRETYALLSEDGFSCEWLSSNDCTELLNTDFFTGAVRMPQDGGFHPVNFVSRISETLKKQGVSVFEKTPVIDIQSSGMENNLEIHLEKGKVDCAMAILATNGYTQYIVPELKDYIVPVIGQAFVTEPVQKSMFREVIYANFGYEYWRQLPDNRIMVGGFREHAKKQIIDISDHIDLELLDGLHDYFTNIFTEARNVCMTHAWSGIMGFSKDGFPILGATSAYPNLFICGGFTGHGLGFSGAIGFTAAELMVNGFAPDADLFHINRFSQKTRNSI